MVVRRRGEGFPLFDSRLEKLKGALAKKSVSHDEFVAKGHNHVSVVLALRLDKERSGWRAWSIGFVLRLLKSSLGTRIWFDAQTLHYSGHSLILLVQPPINSFSDTCIYTSLS